MGLLPLPDGSQQVEDAVANPAGVSAVGGARLADASAEASAKAEAVGGGGGFRLFWWLSLVIIVADQITKAIVRAKLPLYESVPVIDGLVDFIHVPNSGVAFGLLNDLALDVRVKALLTSALAALALIGIGFYARHVRHHERVARVGLSLILGGAVGNLIDRLRTGHVVDFVDVYWGNWHFWAFNVADASITIGATLVFIDLLLVNRHAPNPV
jgi:signal peptidase II